MLRSRGSDAEAYLCSLLRETRVRNGLTQQEVARRLGTPQSFVSKYESGERRLDLVELGQVCSALEVSLALIVEDFQRRFPSR